MGRAVALIFSDPRSWRSHRHVTNRTEPRAGRVALCPRPRRGRDQDAQAGERASGRRGRESLHTAYSLHGRMVVDEGANGQLSSGLRRPCSGAGFAISTNIYSEQSRFLPLSSARRHPPLPPSPPLLLSPPPLVASSAALRDRTIRSLSHLLVPSSLHHQIQWWNQSHPVPIPFLVSYRRHRL